MHNVIALFVILAKILRFLVVTIIFSAIYTLVGLFIMFIIERVGSPVEARKYARAAKQSKKNSK
jgi:hypothetical protein